MTAPDLPELPEPDQAPGSITQDQRLDLWAVIARDTTPDASSARRLEWLAQRIPDWNHGGDLGWLSQKQAGDLLLTAASAACDAGLLREPEDLRPGSHEYWLALHRKMKREGRL